MSAVQDKNSNSTNGTDGNGKKALSQKSSSCSSSDSSKWKIHDTPQDSGLIPTIAVTLWLGWNGIVLWIILYAIFLADNWQRMVIVGAFTLSLVLPANFPGALGFKMGDWMMIQAEKYFGEIILRIRMVTTMYLRYAHIIHCLL